MQSQTRHLVLFILSVVLIFIGYTWLRNRLWPPPKLTPPPERVWAYEQQSAKVQAEILARMAAAPTGNGLGDAYDLALQYAITKDRVEQYAAAVSPPKPAEAPKPQLHPEPAPELIALGGDGYFLNVKLTTRGGGVDQVILNHFHQADRMGLPAKDPNGQPKLLELIPHSEEPSFALYHYARPDQDEERPLDTLGRRNWTAGPLQKGKDEQSLSFTTDLPEQGVRLTKTFTLKQREYHLGLTVRVERLPDAKVTTPFRYQLMGGHGLPIEGVWYTTIFRNALVAWVGSNGRTERVLEDNRTISRTAGSQRFMRLDRQLQYAAVAVQYFASVIAVDDQQPKRNFLEFVRATDEASPDPKNPHFDDITVRAIAEPVEPKPGEPVEHKYVLYHGPIKVRLLGQLRGEQAVAPALVERYESALHLNTLTDYGNWGWWSTMIITCTNIVHWIIGVLRRIIPVEAICIVLVTVIVRGIMFPVSRKQAMTMQRTQEQMAKLQPEIKKIKEKHKNDVLAQQQAMSELYRRHGVNPAAGLGGCLMLILQMPVFLGLYFALQESFFFRLEPFLWIRNLAAPDMLFWWTEKIPFISTPESMGGMFYLGPYFNLLPVLAVTLMMIQSYMTMPPPADEQQAIQQKMMKYMMIFMGILFYKMPAGLCLYFIASTLWGIGERKLLPKKQAAATPAGADGRAAAITAGKPGPRGRGKAKAEEPGKLRQWWEKLLKEASKK
jgi:YidC/Oxa1 family membrane protein insertase